MSIADELTTLRRRLADAELAIERINTEVTHATRELIGVTVAIGTYPTVAGRFYGMYIGKPSGTETEGSTGTITPGSSTFAAYNLGTAIPPVSTSVIVTQVYGIFVFRYDG